MPGRGRVRRRMVGVAVAAVLGLVAVAGAGCTGEEPAAPPDTTAPAGGFRTGGVLRIGAVGLDTLDPALVTPSEHAEMIAADLLFDGLTALPGGVDGAGETAEVEPALAESMTPAEGFRVWRVGLREAEFADGSPVRADDVAFTLQRMARRGAASVSGARLDIIAGYDEAAAGGALSGVTVVDERTLEIRLTDPYADLPVLLSAPVYGIVPRAAVEAAGERFGEAPVGSGPYAYDGRDGDVVRLVRGPAAGERVGPDGVELHRFADEAASYEAFQAGELDWSLVPAGDGVGPGGDGEAEGGEVAVEPFGADVWFGVNQTDPTLANVPLRRAIGKAVDREAIVEEVFPGRLVLDGIVVAGVPGAAADACAGVCDHDPEGARALLAEAFPEGEVPTVVIDTYDDPMQRALVAAVEEDLEAVGIPVEQRVRSFEEYLSFVVSGEAAMFSFGWVGINPTQDAYLGPPFLSGSADNVTGLGSTAIDALVAEARATEDPALRADRYRAIERQLLEAGVLVPIAQLTTTQVVAERVQGLEVRLDGTFPVEGLWLAG